jgi:hypothetical protein
MFFSIFFFVQRINKTWSFYTSLNTFPQSDNFCYFSGLQSIVTYQLNVSSTPSCDGTEHEITASFGIEIDCQLQLSCDRGKTPDGNNFVSDDAEQRYPSGTLLSTTNDQPIRHNWNILESWLKHSKQKCYNMLHLLIFKC